MEHAKNLLAELAANLRWAWSGEYDNLFREIDVELWRRSNHNPTVFLAEAPQEKIAEAATNPHYRVRLERAVRSLRQYLASTHQWADFNAAGLLARPVAYFCAEFGLHESIPIYSGGLGVLAGDHLKSSSDLGVSTYGVGILYRQGYFHQYIDAEGRQQEEYVDTDLKRIAIEQVRDEGGGQLEVRFPVNSENMRVRIWRAEVGRTTLILLEGDRDPPVPGDAFNSRLYGGDQQTRLLQEVMLGVGGYRALKALGVRPSVLHLNEGHSAFAALEAAAEYMEEEGLSFDEAIHRVRTQTIFTTHTPVEAGHDRFTTDLIEKHLDSLRHRLGLSVRDFLGLGRVDPDNSHELFCMTVLALKLSNHANAVSALHGQVSRKMWQGLWPRCHRDEVPIAHITNGVHVPSWVAPDMATLFERNIGPDWLSRLCHPDSWDKINSADPFEVWDVKSLLRRKMLEFVERRHVRRAARFNDRVAPCGLVQHALTIGFARRFAAYKRANLLFRDPERLLKILTDPQRPVQLIFAGKAHPHDNLGKQILEEIYRHSQDPRFQGRVVLLENHDLNVSRHLLQGCDLWLNNPRRPLEACGTSGMKAVFNGTLNLAILDGWWNEAYDGMNGYAFGQGLTHTDPEVQDARDAEDLYRVLEREVVPDFFERSPEDVPTRWVRRMQRALATLAWRYNSDRMVMDYVRHCYLPASGTTTSGLTLIPF